MKFQEIIKELRKDKGISQAELAKKTGLSTGCIGMLEIGKQGPTASTLIALSKFFQVSTDYLLGLEDDFGNIIIKNDTPQLTEKERQMLDMYRQLPDSYQSQVLEYTSYIVERQRGVNYKTN